MGKPLKSMPKVGDHVRYVGVDSLYVTNGDVYEIVGIDSDGEAFFMDDHGDEEYLRPSKFGNFESLDEENEDPGYIDIHEDFDADGDDIDTITISVDRKGYETISKLARKHERIRARGAIEAQIKALQAELNKL